MYESCSSRLGELDQGNIDKGVVGDVNIALLLTGAMGLSSEGGEFAEIVKRNLYFKSLMMRKVLNSPQARTWGCCLVLG